MVEGGWGILIELFFISRCMNIRDIAAIETNLKTTNCLTYMRIFDVLYEIPQRRKSDPAAIKFTDIYQKHCHRIRSNPRNQNGGVRVTMLCNCQISNQLLLLLNH